MNVGRAGVVQGKKKNHQKAPITGSVILLPMWAPSSSYSQLCCNNKRPYAKTSFKNMHFSTHEKAFQQFATEPKNPSMFLQTAAIWRRDSNPCAVNGRPSHRQNTIKCWLRTTYLNYLFLSYVSHVNPHDRLVSKIGVHSQLRDAVLKMSLPDATFGRV